MNAEGIVKSWSRAQVRFPRRSDRSRWCSFTEYLLVTCSFVTLAPLIQRPIFTPPWWWRTSNRRWSRKHRWGQQQQWGPKYSSFLTFLALLPLLLVPGLDCTQCRRMDKYLKLDAGEIPQKQWRVESVQHYFIFLLLPAVRTRYAKDINNYFLPSLCPQADDGGGAGGYGVGSTGGDSSSSGGGENMGHYFQRFWLSSSS